MHTRPFRRMRILFVALLLAPATALAAPLTIDRDFPGGSGESQVDQETRTIRLNPTAHKDRGWVCWWYVRVRGITPGETITLDVGEGVWATPDRAAYSLDGRTWRQTPPGERLGGRIVYSLPIEAEEAWFAWGPPFVPADAQQLVETAAERCSNAEHYVLATSREERPVPALRTAPEAENAPVVWFQARQHAWESGSSWVAKGLIDWVTSEDERAVALRRRAEIHIVPIMDVDNVHLGAGGKNGVPHDHNRDWGEEPHWPAVAAAMKALRGFEEAERLALFIDLHNPGANSKRPFFYIAPDEILRDTGRANLARFLAQAKAEINGPLPFTGETQASGPSYDPRWKFISKNWVTENARDGVVAVTLETAWNTPNSNTEGYQAVGRQLGLAVEAYLREER